MKVHYLVGDTLSICGCNSTSAAWASENLCQRCESKIDKAFSFIAEQAANGNPEAQKFCDLNGVQYKEDNQ